MFNFECRKIINITYFFTYHNIGKRFAEVEMKMALTDILSRYEVEPCEKTEIPITFSRKTVLLMTPNNGVWLKFKDVVDKI